MFEPSFDHLFIVEFKFLIELTKESIKSWHFLLETLGPEFYIPTGILQYESIHHSILFLIQLFLVFCLLGCRYMLLVVGQNVLLEQLHYFLLFETGRLV